MHYPISPDVVFSKKQSDAGLSFSLAVIATLCFNR